MSPILRPVNIREQVLRAANICVEEIVRHGLQFGVQLDVIVLVRQRGATDAEPSVVALVEDQPTIVAMLERAYEKVLSQPNEGEPFSMTVDVAPDV